MDTKTALLDSAERVARERGYDGFSYADLAKDIGIRKASIHYHFPKKEDLALALMERYRVGFFEQLERIKLKRDTGGSRLRDYLNIYRSALSGCDTLCLCVAFSSGRDSLSDSVLSEIQKFHKGNKKWLGETFQLGHEDGSIADVKQLDQEAASCLAIVEGAQLISRSSKNISDFDIATAQLTSRIT